ncbi:hypothetical protein SB00610_02903 [Klebsiella quasipneumoniae subsp. similipneumoniae]|nr:hypothetical protein SB00610_02903 [Klebsiella quasipneumoniae subsp. similipneumoniae]
MRRTTAERHNGITLILTIGFNPLFHISIGWVRFCAAKYMYPNAYLLINRRHFICHTTFGEKCIRHNQYFFDI